MAKRILIGNQAFRIRRGKLVAIPEQWVGKITTKSTIRKRPSKQIRKLRRGPYKVGTTFGVQR